MEISEDKTLSKNHLSSEPFFPRAKAPAGYERQAALELKLNLHTDFPSRKTRCVYRELYGKISYRDKNA